MRQVRLSEISKINEINLGETVNWIKLDLPRRDEGVACFIKTSIIDNYKSNFP